MRNESYNHTRGIGDYFRPKAKMLSPLPATPGPRLLACICLAETSFLTIQLHRSLLSDHQGQLCAACSGERIVK